MVHPKRFNVPTILAVMAAVLRVGDICVSVTHGVLTKATIARFIAGH